MSEILLSWAVSAGVMIAVAVMLGRWVKLPDDERPKPRWLGILLDTRGRFSLNRAQLVIWSIVVISLISGVFFGRLIGNEPEPLDFTIPGNVLGLLGISVGAAVTVGAMKAAKSTEAQSRTGAAAAAVPAPVAPTESDSHLPPRASTRLATYQATGRPPSLGQIFLVEEGEYADDVVDVTKFQSFWFTTILVVAYVAIAINYIVEMKTAKMVTSLPDLKGTFLILLGISYTGYAGGKLSSPTGTPRIAGRGRGAG